MNGEESESQLLALLEQFQIQPNDIEIYRISMTHSSYLNEQGLPTWEGNERLEFLGDAVIGLVVTESLYLTYPEKREGTLSKIKSVVVSRKALGKCAAEIGLGVPLKLGVGESKTGGQRRNSILAAVFESFVGAVYIDKGFSVAKRFILEHLQPIIEDLGEGDSAQDDKSRLQEWAQRLVGAIPRYRVTGSDGPDHNKWFTVEVSLKGHPIGHGEGSSKKTAEKNAAMVALARVEEMEDQEILEQMGLTNGSENPDPL
ncbi:MAG: ribonuclease III [Candidatus Omnitrophica bacterium]|nr:ribonuclease III [Candidatus Omnitrophota bacterium]MCB9766739.1 ribonuclease III [Candidatus Omnitrophota bacterium]